MNRPGVARGIRRFFDTPKAPRLRANVVVILPRTPHPLAAPFVELAPNRNAPASRLRKQYDTPVFQPRIHGIHADMGARAKRNMHVPLPEPLHDRLRAEAKPAGRPATALAREAIETWVEEHQRQAVHDAIAEYAGTMAGSAADRDEALEEAGIDRLFRRAR